MRNLVPSIFAFAVLALLAHGQSPSNSSYEEFVLSPAIGLEMINSRNPRDGVWASYQFVKPEPRFRALGYDAQLVIEPYGIYSRSRKRSSVQDLYHVGVLATARYWIGPKHFVEGGFGLQYVSDKTPDFGSAVNSTPTIGIGWVVQLAGSEALLSARVHHISNAGIRVPNTGGNFLLISLTYPR